MFLGIKGVYYECEVPGQGGEPVRVRWLEGFEFQQHVPHDVDFRILLTFLDLYRTMVGFVLFKLYTDENLVYPPPLDVELDEQGESVGAFKLVERKAAEGADGKTQVSKKAVRKAIKGIKAAGDDADVDMDEDAEEANEEEDEDFVERPSKAQEVDDVASAPLTTYNSLLATSCTPAPQNLLFSPYTFYLSRETSSRTWEFVVRAMGGKIITSLTAPTPADAHNADSITHVIIDRPITAERMREMEAGRKWVWIQPQWVADCVNKQKIISSEGYGPGQLLPPHLSPWDGEGELYRPWLEEQGEKAAEGEEGEDEEEAAEQDEGEYEDEEEEGKEEVAAEYPPALLAAAQNPSDASLLHAAELEAETNGVSHSAFRAQLKEATKVHAKKVPVSQKEKKGEEDLRKIMMSNKKAKLYEKMQYSNRERAAEKEKLEKKRKAIEKRKAKEAKA